MATNPIVTGMTGRYATAFFDLAVESDQLQQVETDLRSFSELLNQSKDLQQLVRSPVFSAEDQKNALSAILKLIGYAPLTCNFLELVAKNRRLFAIQGMVDGFIALLADHRGEVTADVTSANALSESQLSSLKEALKSAIGRDVLVKTSVDASVLGGLVVKVGSRMIDGSLRTKLNNLKIAMKEVG